MFESCGGSFSIHPSGLISYHCKNDSLSYQLKCLVFSDSAGRGCRCLFLVSPTPVLFLKRAELKNVTEKPIWGVAPWEVERGLCGGTAEAVLIPVQSSPGSRGNWLERWRGFLRELAREMAERRAEGRRCSLPGSCGVLDWEHSLILPVAPGHSSFKCSRTKQTKMAPLLQGQRQMCIDRKCACGGNLALTWLPGLWLPAIISRSNWLSVLCPFSANKEALAYLSFVFSVGLCR